MSNVRVEKNGSWEGVYDQKRLPIIHIDSCVGLNAPVSFDWGRVEALMEGNFNNRHPEDDFWAIRSDIWESSIVSG
jgi:hypothetical protein